MSEVHIRVDRGNASLLQQRLGSVHSTVLQALALLLPVLVSISAEPARAGLALVALSVALFWEAVFLYWRRRRISCHAVTTGMIVTVMIPVSLPLWQLGIVLSMGVVLAEQVFGGRGFGFLNSAAVSLALLVFSFPEHQLTGGGYSVALAVLPGAILLLAAGLLSGRVLAGFVVAGALCLATSSGGVGADLVGAGVVASFGLVFLVGDGFAAASTNQGRWLYGALAGGLFVLLGAHPEAVVFAALLASLSAPLLDVIGQRLMRRRVV